MAREDQNIIRDGYGYAEAIIDAADEVLDMGRFHKCEGEPRPEDAVLREKSRCGDRNPCSGATKKEADQ